MFLSLQRSSLSVLRLIVGIVFLFLLSMFLGGFRFSVCFDNVANMFCFGEAVAQGAEGSEHGHGSEEEDAVEAHSKEVKSEKVHSKDMTSEKLKSEEVNAKEVTTSEERSGEASSETLPLEEKEGKTGKEAKVSRKKAEKHDANESSLGSGITWFVGVFALLALVIFFFT